MLLKHMTKTGGFLSLLPLILGGLSPAGAVTGGAAGISRSVMLQIQRQSATIRRLRQSLRGKVYVYNNALDVAQCVVVVAYIFQRTRTAEQL